MPAFLAVRQVILEARPDEWRVQFRSLPRGEITAPDSLSALAKAKGMFPFAQSTLAIVPVALLAPVPEPIPASEAA